jgi:hypothetical protein
MWTIKTHTWEVEILEVMIGVPQGVQDAIRELMCHVIWHITYFGSKYSQCLTNVEVSYTAGKLSLRAFQLWCYI